MFAPNEKLANQLGQRAVIQPFIEDAFHFRRTAFQSVADHDQFGPVIQIGFAVPLENADATRFQECGHWRVDILVAARHGIPDVPAQRRNGCHGRTANSDKVN